MADARNIKLGVCTVTYKGAALGHTIGGVTVTYTPIVHETKPDLYGDSVAKVFLVGETLEADFNLAEWTFANLQVAIAQGASVGADADTLTVGNVAGKDLSLTGGLVVFHPQANAATNFVDDISFYKAVVTGPVKIAHDNKGEKMIPIKMIAVVDENRADGNLLGFIGDSIN